MFGLAVLLTPEVRAGSDEAPTLFRPFAWMANETESAHVSIGRLKGAYPVWNVDTGLGVGVADYGYVLAGLWTEAGLTLTDCGRVMLTDNLARMGCLTMAEGSVIDLNGKRLAVSSVKLGATRLHPGTYRASDTVVAGFIADFKGTDGTLVVSGGGFALIIR